MFFKVRKGLGANIAGEDGAFLVTSLEVSGQLTLSGKGLLAQLTLRYLMD